MPEQQQQRPNRLWAITQQVLAVLIPAAIVGLIGAFIGLRDSVRYHDIYVSRFIECEQNKHATCFTKEQAGSLKESLERRIDRNENSCDSLYDRVDAHYEIIQECSATVRGLQGDLRNLRGYRLNE